MRAWEREPRLRPQLVLKISAPAQKLSRTAGQGAEPHNLELICDSPGLHKARRASEGHAGLQRVSPWLQWVAGDLGGLLPREEAQSRAQG